MIIHSSNCSSFYNSLLVVCKCTRVYLGLGRVRGPSGRVRERSVREHGRVVPVRVRGRVRAGRHGTALRGRGRVRRRQRLRERHVQQHGRRLRVPLSQGIHAGIRSGRCMCE